MTPLRRASCHVYAEAGRAGGCFGCARGGRTYDLASLLSAALGAETCAVTIQVRPRARRGGAALARG